MSTTDAAALLRRAFSGAAANHFFLASALAAYEVAHGMDEAALAAWLDCSVEDLPRLGLCRRPDSASPAFGAEVRQIALYAGTQPLRLAQLLREVDARAALEREGSSTTLLAARDASPDDDSE